MCVYDEDFLKRSTLLATFNYYSHQAVHYIPMNKHGIRTAPWTGKIKPRCDMLPALTALRVHQLYNEHFYSDAGYSDWVTWSGFMVLLSFHSLPGLTPWNHVDSCFLLSPLPSSTTCFLQVSHLTITDGRAMTHTPFPFPYPLSPS